MDLDPVRRDAGLTVDFVDEERGALAFACGVPARLAPLARILATVNPPGPSLDLVAPPMPPGGAVSVARPSGTCARSPSARTGASGAGAAGGATAPRKSAGRRTS